MRKGRAYSDRILVRVHNSSDSLSIIPDLFSLERDTAPRLAREVTPLVEDTRELILIPHLDVHVSTTVSIADDDQDPLLAKHPGLQGREPRVLGFLYNGRSQDAVLLAEDGVGEHAEDAGMRAAIVLGRLCIVGNEVANDRTWRADDEP